MATTLTIQRIRAVLESKFVDHIDISDIKKKSEEQRHEQAISRALAAYCIHSLTRVDPQLAAASVTDAYDDGGIDAIYFDADDDTLYFVQSKWSDNARGTIDLADANKFIAGVQAVVRSDFSCMNEKVRKREQELTLILRRSDVRIVLVAAYMSPDPLPTHPRRAIEEYLREQNNVGDIEVFTLEVFNLPRIYSLLSGPPASRDIKLQIGLTEWGTVDSPYRAYYGQVKIADVAQWTRFGRAILDKNIRFHRGATDVNDAMERTLVRTPRHFWYFNNGITVLCESATKPS